MYRLPSGAHSPAARHQVVSSRHRCAERSPRRVLAVAVRWPARRRPLLSFVLAAAASTTAEPTRVACSHDAGTKKTNGTACGCDGDCASGFCADGVCCNTACTETLQGLQHGLGPRDLHLRRGRRPAANAFGVPEDERHHLRAGRNLRRQGGLPGDTSAGTVCQPGTCDGASVGGIRVCDGSGQLHARAGHHLRAVQLRRQDQRLRRRPARRTRTAPPASSA